MVFTLVLDCKETLFNLSEVVFREVETMSKVPFADQKEELTLLKQADRAFTVEEIFHTVLETFSANRDTLLKYVAVLARLDDTVLREAFVSQ